MKIFQPAALLVILSAPFGLATTHVDPAGIVGHDESSSVSPSLRGTVTNNVDPSSQGAHRELTTFETYLCDCEPEEGQDSCTCHNNIKFTSGCEDLTITVKCHPRLKVKDVAYDAGMSRRISDHSCMDHMDKISCHDYFDWRIFEEDDYFVRVETVVCEKKLEYEIKNIGYTNDDNGGESLPEGIELQLCEGDCDYDSDCGEGLKCYHRDKVDGNCYYIWGQKYCGFQMIQDVLFPAFGDFVPGCVGIPHNGWDYCVPENINLGDIFDVATSPDNGSKLQHCEGNCDSDSECDNGLKCFHREKDYHRVPGCKGFPRTTWDYCIKEDEPVIINTGYSNEENGGESLPEGIKLQRCQGDCINDHDCGDGLRCFQRDAYQRRSLWYIHYSPHELEQNSTLVPGVPGCEGGPWGPAPKEGWNYCVRENEIINLGCTDEENGGLGLPEGIELQRCEGDCDQDHDCGEGLRCFQRDDDENVPGCEGTPASGWDYCIRENDIMNTGYSGGGNGGESLPEGIVFQRCEGDCDYDDDCGEGLRCFQRDNDAKVPGCEGMPNNNWDYCIRENEIINIAPVVHSMHFTGYTSETVGELQRCEGSCDQDHDCAEGLKCFQREGDENVPGCQGTANSNWNYCIRVNEIISIARYPEGDLKNCEGYCSFDNCGDGLRCFYRGSSMYHYADGDSDVPGCEGTPKKDWDYCVKEAFLFPTENPTAVPTKAPTHAPTMTPTNTPTASPTNSPTEIPTTVPTNAPSGAPTESPTLRPTMSPTAAPTHVPTMAPTNTPTASPTLRPTMSPTAAPTNAPSDAPTGTPTASPSASPTMSPTDIPTKAPTGTPTASPSASPTRSPTLVPTNVPSKAPTAVPTASPSASPTMSPTAAPTNAPSDAPTGTPTASPSASPTMSPTSVPTNAPSDAPTGTPTASPSASPTMSPTAAPTNAPSDAPTGTPTASPSASPTMSPTSVPTNAPSKAPTGTPTASPSASPTMSPTAAPTNAPSDAPTGTPTASPSASPTMSPTAAPTNAPSDAPTGTPTASPSVSPSKSPTSVPTNAPSKAAKNEKAKREKRTRF